VALYLLQHVPLPNGPGREFTFSGAPLLQSTNEYLAKLDYILGRHHLSGHYFQINYRVPIVRLPSSNILKINSNPAASTIRRNVSVVDLYSVTNRFFLSSYFGYTRQNGLTLSNVPFNMADAGVSIAEPPTLPGGKGPGLDIQVDGGLNIHGSNYGEFDRADQSVREIATLMKGNHTLRFGGEFLRIGVPVTSENQEDGIFGFSNSLSGDNTADFMLGAVSTFAQAGGLYLNLDGTNWSTFLQDDWRATPRFTLNAGLRWDPFFPYKDSLGRAACFVPGAQSTRYPNAPQGLIFGGSKHDLGCPQSSVVNNPWNLGPRLGLTAQLTSDGKTTLRSGAGYYYDPPNTAAFQDVAGVPPFASIVELTDVSLSDPYRSAGIPNPFPALFGPADPGPAATFPRDIGLIPVFSRHFRLPVVLTWNLTVERSLAQSWVVRAGYFGNHGTRLNGTGNQEAGLLQVNPATYIPGKSTEANTQQRRIYSAFSTLNLLDSEVNSNYNGLQLTLEKRFTRGFGLVTNYTWARTLDNFGPGGSGNERSPSGSNSCTCGRAFDYGPAIADFAQVLRGSGNYMVPRLAIDSFLGRVMNGWGLNGIVTWRSGFPYTVFSRSDNSRSGIGADRADLTVANRKEAVLSSSRPHAQLAKEWFNTTAFTTNAIGTFGNSGENALRGPGFFNTDLAVVKNTDLENGLSLQFRAEFYNALNDVNFGMPDSGLTDSSFGQITYALSPRILQFSLKALF
jgi:hypothetical protein